MCNCHCLMMQKTKISTCLCVHFFASLYGNNLTGHIPTEIGLMTKLWHVGKYIASLTLRITCTQTWRSAHIETFLVLLNQRLFRE